MSALRCRPVALLMLVLFLGACTTWQPGVVSPRQLIEEGQPRVVRVTSPDSVRRVVRNPRIENEAIVVDAECRSSVSPLGGYVCPAETVVALCWPGRSGTKHAPPLGFRGRGFRPRILRGERLLEEIGQDASDPRPHRGDLPARLTPTSLSRTSPGQQILRPSAPPSRSRIPSMAERLVLQNKHTGERLELRRVELDGEMCLELRGSLPPRSEGPPMHIHWKEHEVGTVHAGQLTAMVDGKRIQAGPGESAELPLGLPHRWWNEGDVPLQFTGYARPVVDLDHYLQAVSEVVNAGAPNRPSLIYMAHVALRHRETQAVLLMPRPIQGLLFRMAYLIGRLTGAYRGTDWPGCPERCTGAPMAPRGSR